jgi:hypothetical protein
MSHQAHFDILPKVVCICPSRSRPRFLARARQCFEAQTYPNKRLYVLNTAFPPFAGAPIGTLRNVICQSSDDADIIAHWDDDDWSCPWRLAEQVALLTSRRSLQAVGYQDMLFYDSRVGHSWIYRGAPGFIIGTSLMYWRSTWDTKRFQDTSEGEDGKFQDGLYKLTRSAVTQPPRMIAEIHGVNTWGKIYANTNEFQRTPESDAVCARELGYDRT